VQQNSMSKLNINLILYWIGQINLIEIQSSVKTYLLF
jgi:hypothetical protein